MDPDLRRSLEELRDDIKTVHDEAVQAHEEARGAHQQASVTNGRVNDLEDSNLELRAAMWGPEQLGVHTTDAGVVGVLREVRVLVRVLVAVMAVVAGPVAAAAVTNLAQAMF